MPRANDLGFRGGDGAGKIDLDGGGHDRNRTGVHGFAVYAANPADQVVSCKPAPISRIKHQSLRIIRKPLGNSGQLETKLPSSLRRLTKTWTLSEHPVTTKVYSS